MVLAHIFQHQAIQPGTLPLAKILPGAVRPHGASSSGNNRDAPAAEPRYIGAMQTTDLDALSPDRLAADIAAHGYARRPVLTDSECREVAALYADEQRFRKRIIMEHHAYGRGEYKYLAYPLPAIVARLRQTLYPPLSVIANDWRRSLGEAGGAFPPTLDAFLAQCHAAGQTRPTPLLLRYGPDDFNCLHQDLYGEMVFPLQVTILLSEPGIDFTGGEFVLVEQRPRAQSRPEVVPLAQGEAVMFPVHHRPARGARGPYRLTMRHGVSRIRSGLRQTLGIIFHDAA
jgi:hypothetical protein